MKKTSARSAIQSPSLVDLIEQRLADRGAHLTAIAAIDDELAQVRRIAGDVADAPETDLTAHARALASRRPAPASADRHEIPAARAQCAADVLLLLADGPLSGPAKSVRRALDELQANGRVSRRGLTGRGVKWAADSTAKRGAPDGLVKVWPLADDPKAPPSVLTERRQARA